MDVLAQQQQRAPGPPAALADVVVALGKRRATAISSANARSAVVSVSTPGVLPTGTPRRVQAGDVDVVEADREVADDLELRPGRVQQLVVHPVGQQRQHAVHARDTRAAARPAAAAARPSQTSASRRRAARRRPASGIRRVTKTRGRSVASLSRRSRAPAGRDDLRDPFERLASMFSRELAYETRMWSAPDAAERGPDSTLTPASSSSRSASSAPSCPCPLTLGKA